MLNPTITELSRTLKSTRNKKQGKEDLIANIIAHSVSIRPIRARVFNAFNNIETLTGLDYPLGNNIILDSGSTYNIGNAKLYFNPDSFWPFRKDEENAIFTSNIIILIKLYKMIRVIV